MSNGPETPANASDGPDANDKKRCFVVMGFGTKTDYATGRKLDLNKSYRLLIKEVVESLGHECVRADEIRHSGVIDVPMYEELLTADVVIADISTANPNALYELGIRHALRPYTTIVIAESKLPYPFDLNHVAITRYAHLGDAIDFDEVMRFRKELKATLERVLHNQKEDSPVYTFLKKLAPPTLSEPAEEAVEQAGRALQQASTAIAEAESGAAVLEAGQDNQSLAALVQQGERCIEASDFSAAKALFEAARQLSKDESGFVKNDPYILQRLVLATYKAKQPDEVTALHEAMKTLGLLDPEDSNDPETVGLAGAISKRLFDQRQGAEHLDHAIRYYSRGYYLRNDWYNGINLAYLLNVRADTPLAPSDQERIADLVWANRIRREVLALCERDLRAIREREERLAGRSGEAGAEVKEEQTARDREQEFWCLATEAEAYFGLGEKDDYEAAHAEAEKVQNAHFPEAAWMMETFENQIRKLEALLEKHEALLSSQ